MNSVAAVYIGGRPRRFRVSSSLRPGRYRFLRKMTDLILLVTLLSSVNFVSDGPAHAQGVSEYEVKAAFLFNFAKFVEWPPEAFSDSGAPLIIGIIGDDPFGSAIDQTIDGKTVNGRRLMIRRLRWGQNLRGCHVLFVSSSEQKRLSAILEHLKGACVLTVSEMGQFIQQGGIIGFVIEASKVRFEINTSAAEPARLRISAKLLALAKVVRNGKSAGGN